MDSEPRSRVRGVSAKTLSSQGYAVCLFPEQPTRKVIVEQDRGTEEVFKKTEVAKVEAKKSTELEYVRLYWRNRLVYVIALIAFTLSLNNVYHFPMNIYRYGENFFIPYTVVTIFIGYPLHILEVSLGQYCQRGALWMWECAPLFCGVGFAMVLACIVISFYHNIFAAYSLVYFAHCFHKNFPWTYCRQKSGNESDHCAPPSWYVSPNITLPSREYFYTSVLDNQKDLYVLWPLGSLKWWLMLALLFSWIVTYVAVLRSARSIGKISVCIVIFSYFTILMLVIVALQLKDTWTAVGVASEGKEFVSAFSLEMWGVATMQVFVELGLCYGIPITYGSYCRFRNVFWIDSLILCIMNYIHSVIFFFLFFSFMMRYSCNINDILWGLSDNTIALVYILYSEAFANLPGGHFWCMTFFLMLFCIIIGTQIAVVEVIMTSIYDNSVALSKKRWLINLVICGIFVLVGLFFCFTNGFFGAIFLRSVPILSTVVPLTFLLVVGVVFVYGLKHYFEDISLMHGSKDSSGLKLYLYILLLLLFLILLIIIFTRPVSTLSGDGVINDYYIFMWLLCVIIICPVLIFAVIWIIYCLIDRKRVMRSSNIWRRFYDERAEEKGQFTKNYSSSYVWEWNKY